MAEKRPDPTTVMGEEAEKYLFQWYLEIQKKGLQGGVHAYI